MKNNYCLVAYGTMVLSYASVNMHASATYAQHQSVSHGEDFNEGCYHTTQLLDYPPARQAWELQTRRLTVSSALAFFSTILAHLSTLIIATKTQDKIAQRAATLEIASAIFNIASEMAQKEAVQEPQHNTPMLVPAQPDSFAIIETTRSFVHAIHQEHLTTRSSTEPCFSDQKFQQEIAEFIRKLSHIFGRQLATSEPLFVEPIEAIVQDLLSLCFYNEQADQPLEKEEKLASDQCDDEHIKIGKLTIINRLGGKIAVAQECLP